MTGAAAAPAMAQAPTLTGVRMKITDIKIVRLRVLQNLGPITGFMGPNDVNQVIVGGGSIIEIHTDQGLIGIGPGIDPVQLPRLRGQLIGQDPFNIEMLWDQMFRASLPYGRKGLPIMALSAVDVALWDLIGKARGELYIACAEHDELAPLPMVEELRRLFERSGAAGEIELYPGVHHGFAFPQRWCFDKPAAERHWERLIALYRRRLERG